MAYSFINDERTKSSLTFDSIRKQNRESFTLLWFDPNIGTMIDTETTMKELRSINDFVQFHTDFDVCQRFIESINQEKIILITSGSSAIEILNLVAHLNQIDSIFIFCMKKTCYKHLIGEYVKIQGIYTDLNDLSESIRQRIRMIEHEMNVFCFYDDHQNSTTDLSERSPEFLWFQLFKYVILRLPRNSQSKKQMIDECREYYRGNEKELNLINLFEENYRRKDAIRWYSKESFVYKLVNKALRSEDIDQLYRFRFFIGDLSASLARVHRKYFETNEKTKFIVYRGAKISRNEYRRLLKSRGNLISMNGFLSTSRRRSLAVRFALERNFNEETIPILYEIECDVEKLGESVVFADLSSMSEYADEEEILFDLSVTFRLEDVTHDETIRILHLKASNEEKEILRVYLDDASRQTEQMSPAIVFGKFMTTLGQFDKALNYFQQLKNDSNDNDLAWIEFHLGRIFYFKNEFKKAKEHYDRSYRLMINAEPARIKDSAHVLNSLGVLQDRRQRFDKAKEYYERVLIIQEQFSSSNDPDIARTLDNIGVTHFNQKQYDAALIHHLRALTLRETIYRSGHADIALTLNNIGLILHVQKKYRDALSYHQRALELQQQFYPKDHIDTSHTFTCIANVYLSQKKYHRALKFYKKAFEIEEKNSSKEHLQIADILHNIGLTFEGLEDRQSARESFLSALEFYGKISPVPVDRHRRTLEKIQQVSEYA